MRSSHEIKKHKYDNKSYKLHSSYIVTSIYTSNKKIRLLGAVIKYNIKFLNNAVVVNKYFY